MATNSLLPEAIFPTPNDGGNGRDGGNDDGNGERGGEQESSYRSTTGGRMSPATQDAVARMLVSGAPISTIAHATGRTPASVRATLNGPQMQERIEAVRAAVIRHTSMHYFEMMEFLPDARAAIAAGLAGGDLRMRVDIAKWLHENLTPSQVKRAEVDVHHSGGTTVDLTPVLEQIGTSVAQLLAADKTGPDMMEFVKTGAEALPRAVVGDGDV